MNLRPFLAAVAGVLLLFAGWRAYGGAGLAIVATGLVTWMLLWVTRMIHVLKKAAERPKGYVGSAVMLNAKLKSGVTLLHVVAMTKSLGEPMSAPDQQPELFRWSDGGLSHVTCEFLGGKLVKWALVRPEPAADQPASPIADALTAPSGVGGCGRKSMEKYDRFAEIVAPTGISPIRLRKKMGICTNPPTRA